MRFEWSGDVDQAAWWADALHPFATDVGSVIPNGLTAYARVFHPATDDDGVPRRWGELAAVNGRIVHPEMQLHEIVRPLRTTRRGYEPNDWINRAVWGSLPLEELAVLGETLALHTSTPERCWCCVWEGYGQLRGGPAAATLTTTGGTSLLPMALPDVIDGSRVKVPGRSYYLLRGPLSDLPELFDHLHHQSPNVWWPHDRAWCVATEIDFAWTYVGGSAAAIDAVVAERRLEALIAKTSDRFAHDSDLLNAALDR